MSVSFQLSVVRNGCRIYLNYTENDWNGGLLWWRIKKRTVTSPKNEIKQTMNDESAEKLAVV